MDESAEEQGHIFVYGVFVASVHGQSENVVQEAVMDNDAEERSGGEQWIDRAKGAALDPLADIVRQQIVKGPVLPLKKHIG